MKSKDKAAAELEKLYASTTPRGRPNKGTNIGTFLKSKDKAAAATTKEKATERNKGLYGTDPSYLLAAYGGDAVKLAAMTTRPEAAPTHSDAGKKGGRPKKASVSAVALKATKEKARSDDYGLSRGSDGRGSEYLAARIARDYGSPPPTKTRTRSEKSSRNLSTEFFNDVLKLTPCVKVLVVSLPGAATNLALNKLYD